jgi:rSAM/selenodomain-associated transferase 1
MEQSLLILARNPKLGRVKTRLAATIGSEKALEVYRQLLEYTVSVTKDLPFPKTVFYSDFIDNSDCWDRKLYGKQLQAGHDLGERISNSFSYAFNQGNKEVIIIGTDCFELSSIALTEAFCRLKSQDVVIGPAYDGGYYLLGMKAYSPKLFENISWSTGKVLEETISVCKDLHLSFALLPVLADLDDEEGLKLFDNQRSQKQGVL